MAQGSETALFGYVLCAINSIIFLVVLFLVVLQVGDNSQNMNTRACTWTHRLGTLASRAVPVVDRWP